MLKDGGRQGMGSHADEHSRSGAATGLAGTMQSRMARTNVAREGDREGDEVVLTRPARTWVPVLTMVCFFCQ